MTESTANQIVAWNMAYFRKAAGLTQEELGAEIGWSKAIVSAAERSWDSTRVRQFTADDLVLITNALSIPLLALFLPPPGPGGRPAGALTDLIEEQLKAARDIDAYVPCGTCGGGPPQGFTCNECGRSGTEDLRQPLAG